MPAPDEIDRRGALPRERACPSCDHPFHFLRCGYDLLEGVFCPCRAPVPGT